ncbi:MAG: TonB-dependent receptor [Thermoanaerobaculia bacterium]
MTNKLLRMLLLTAVTLVVAHPLLAQTTASLTGTVTLDGVGIPGVTVSLSSPNLQGTRDAVSGDGGGYSFAALPPGTYTVTFHLEGMQRVTRSVTVSLATVARADAELTVSAVAEAITVTANAPSVMETSQVASNFSYDEVDTLPINRNPLAVAALAPGVQGDTTAGNNSLNTLSANQLVISGSPGYDNLIMVNGVAIMESIRSQAQPLYIEDAVQETTVLTGAISAEFGRFTGGVVNSITKSGGNEFSGSLRDSLDNPSWTRKTDFATQADPVDILNETYEATLGGYVLRDRLWFFSAGRYRDRATSFSTITHNPCATPLSANCSIDSTPLAYVRGDEETRWEVKLTGQIAPSHNVVGSYLDKKRYLTNNQFTTNIYDLASLSKQDTPEHLLSLHYSGIVRTNLLIEGQYSQRELKFENSGSQFTDLLRGTLMINVGVTPNARFASPTFCGVCDTESRRNDSLLLKSSYFLSTKGLGDHNIVAGAEQFSEQRYANNFQSGSNFRIHVPAVRVINNEVYPTIDSSSASRIRWTPIFEGANDSDLQTRSFFVNDTWDLNTHWSFNLGVRYDKNDSVDGVGNTTSDDQAFSPRLTAMYDFAGNGRHRVSASYNKYVSRVVEGAASNASSAGVAATIDMQYRGPVINPLTGPATMTAEEALAALFAWFDENGGTSNVAGLLHPNGTIAIPGLDYVYDGTLQSPSVDELVVGYGVQLSPRAFAKIDAIYRDWNDFYARRITQDTGSRNDQFGVRHDQAIVYNTNDIEREYRGLQLQAQWRPGRLTSGFSYTWSELKGNDEGETGASGPVLNSPLAAYYPELAGYAQRLPNGYIDQFDMRHKAKAWVAYNVDFGRIGSLSPSLLHSYHSGVAYSAIGAITMPFPGAPTLPYSRSLLGAQNYYFSDRGQFRTDAVHQTDLSLNYTVPLWRVQLFAQGDLLNVFNNQAVEDVNFVTRTVLTQANAACQQSSNGPTPGARCLAFNPFTDTPVEGTHYRVDSNFGRPNNFQAYQLPLTYRFAVGVRF